MSPQRIAHLGPRATNTEAAAVRFDPEAELIPVANVAAAVQAVERGDADLAMVAAENAIDGAVRETLDQLVRSDLELRVTGELVLPIRHVLVGAPGIDPRAAERVYSHPQALAQCREHLRELAPHAAHVAALSTTAGIEAAIAEVGALGVGPPIAAEFYGGEVYAEDIGEHPAQRHALPGAGRRRSGRRPATIRLRWPSRPSTIALVLWSRCSSCSRRGR